MLADKAVAS